MPEFAAKQPKALCCGGVKTDTERNMLLENVEKYIIWLFFYSVVGWIYESTLCSVRAHKFINRGFLNGPYCPIYGWGAVLDILILGKVQNPVLLFFLGAIVTCSLEYFTSYIMEKLFHARWWDYSKRKFNINGRVCLLGAVVFGAFSVILIKLVHPLVSDVTNSLPRAALHWLAAVMFAIIAADECVTIGGIAGFNKKLKELAAATENVKADIGLKLHDKGGLGSEVYNAVHNAAAVFVQKLNAQQRRILAAFPKLRTMEHNDILNDVRKLIADVENRRRKNKNKHND